MKNKFRANIILVVTILSSAIYGKEEDPVSTLNITNDNLDSHYNENSDQVVSSSTISEKNPDPIGMPQPGDSSKPHPHQKHNNPTDRINSHPRSPVYEVVTQPCYSPGCAGGFGPQDALVGSRWNPGRNRFQPYPKYYEPRRRGGYGPNYAPEYPDYGYGSRGYPRGRVGGFGRPAFEGGYGRPAFEGGYGRPAFDGGYARPMYDDYFLG